MKSKIYLRKIKHINDTCADCFFLDNLKYDCEEMKEKGKLPSCGTFHEGHYYKLIRIEVV